MYVYEEDSKIEEVPPETNRGKKKKYISEFTQSLEYFVFPDEKEILLHGA